VLVIPTAALPHRVTVERYAGPSAYGPTWDAPVKMRARLTGRRRAVKTADGVDVIADATAEVRPCKAIPAESKITDSHGREFTVVGVADNPGLVRDHNTELILSGPRPAGGT
jgi:hypothetical protein